MLGHMVYNYLSTKDDCELTTTDLRWPDNDFKKKMRSVFTSSSLFLKEAAILKEHLLKEYTEEKIYNKYLDCMASVIPELRINETLDDNEFALFELENND